MLLTDLRTNSLTVSGTEAGSYLQVSGPSIYRHLHWYSGLPPQGVEQLGLQLALDHPILGPAVICEEGKAEPEGWRCAVAKCQPAPCVCLCSSESFP